jgi:hypothetical protein
MQLFRIIYFSLAALHVSSDIFARHQGHLTVLQFPVLHTYVGASWQRHKCVIPEAVLQFRYS